MRYLFLILSFHQAFFEKTGITNLEISGRCAKIWIANSHEDIAVRPFHFKNGHYRLLKNQVKTISGKGKWRSSGDECPYETDERNASDFTAAFRFRNSDLIKIHLENLCSIDALILENLKIKINSVTAWFHESFTRFDKHFDTQPEDDTIIIRGGFFIYPESLKVSINQTVFRCKKQTCSEL